MLATIRNKTEQTSARVLVFAIFVEMHRKLLDSPTQHRNLHLRRARVALMTLCLFYLVLLLSLCKHGDDNITFAPIKQAPNYPIAWLWQQAQLQQMARELVPPSPATL